MPAAALAEEAAALDGETTAMWREPDELAGNYVTQRSVQAQPDGVRVFEATAQGYHGDVVVRTTFDGNAIEAVEVISCTETIAVGRYALKEVGRRIVEHQSVNVDSVAGASISSYAIKAAVADCVGQAGLSGLDEEVHEEYAQPAEDCSTEVLIAGGSGVGMKLAILLARKGVKVTIVEKRQIMGGTSSRASYQFDTYGTRTQREAIAADPSIPVVTAGDMWTDHVKNELEDLYDKEFLMRAVLALPECADFIKYDMNMPMEASPSGISLRMPPAYTEAGLGWGAYYMNRMWQELDRLGVDYRLQTEAKEILVDANGRACGLTVENPNGTYDIAADYTVITTGSFDFDEEAFERYCPNWVGYPSTFIPDAKGDGIWMAERAGAALSGMDEAHLMVYTSCVKVTDTEAVLDNMRAAGAIMVNMEGRRFWNEVDMAFKDLADAAREQTEGRYFGICDSNFAARNGGVDGCESADTLEELAGKLGIDPEGLADECARYTQFYEQGEDEDFGRPQVDFPVCDPPFYGRELITARHGFDGGISVDNSTMQVLKVDGTPFEGLYAAGCGVDSGIINTGMYAKAYEASLLAEVLLGELGC